MTPTFRLEINSVVERMILFPAKFICPQVDDETFSRRPTRTKFFFNPKMITNREIALLSLLVLAEEKEEKLSTQSGQAEVLC